MRIAIMGAGGTGGYFGVTLIARGAHLEAIRTHGLTLKSRLAGDFTLRVEATDNPGEVGPVDLVLFCVKTYDTATAAEQMRPLVGPDTMVLSTQNGIDNEEQIAKVVGSEPVIGAVDCASSKIEAPGVIAHLMSGPGRSFSVSWQERQAHAPSGCRGRSKVLGFRPRFALTFTFPCGRSSFSSAQ